MSQEKVDYNKKQKQNRKQLVKERKQKRAAGIAAAVLVAAVFVGWIGYSSYLNYEADREANPTYYDINVDSLSEYLSSIN